MCGATRDEGGGTRPMARRRRRARGAAIKADVGACTVPLQNRVLLPEPSTKGHCPGLCLRPDLVSNSANAAAVRPKRRDPPPPLPPYLRAMGMRGGLGGKLMGGGYRGEGVVGLRIAVRYGGGGGVAYCRLAMPGPRVGSASGALSLCVGRARELHRGVSRGLDVAGSGWPFSLGLGLLRRGHPRAWGYMDGGTWGYPHVAMGVPPSPRPPGHAFLGERVVEGGIP